MSSAAWGEGRTADLFSDCPYLSGQRVYTEWLDGFVVGRVERGVMPDDAPPYIRGRIGYLLNPSVTNDLADAAPDDRNAQYAGGWLAEKKRNPPAQEFTTDFAADLDSRFGSDESIGVMVYVTATGMDGSRMFSAAEFEAWFQGDKENEHRIIDAQSVMPNGGVTNCTNYARHVQSALEAEGHQVQVVGFTNEDNPDCAVVREDLHPGGHDFAIVDGRYLVDPWIRLVPMARDKIVYDLHDPTERCAATRVYGNPELWRDLDDNQPARISVFDPLGADNPADPEEDQHSDPIRQNHF